MLFENLSPAPLEAQLGVLVAMKVGLRRRRWRLGRQGYGQQGFSLLELIVVVSIIGILAALAMPNLVQQPRRTQEAVLKTNLRTIRQAIDQYYGDIGNYPEALDALAEEGYLRNIPLDPIYGEREWDVVFEENTYDYDDLEVDDSVGPGIIDVFSLSGETAIDGTPYNEW